MCERDNLPGRLIGLDRTLAVKMHPLDIDSMLLMAGCRAMLKPVSQLYNIDLGVFLAVFWTDQVGQMFSRLLKFRIFCVDGNVRQLIG